MTESAASQPAAVSPTDADRLAKLWEAYRVQEGELQAALARVDEFKQELDARGNLASKHQADLAAKDEQIVALNEQLQQRDARIEQLEGYERDVAAVGAYQDRIRDLEAALTREKERLTKLYLLYEQATGGAPSE